MFRVGSPQETCVRQLASPRGPLFTFLFQFFFHFLPGSREEKYLFLPWKGNYFSTQKDVQRDRITCRKALQLKIVVNTYYKKEEGRVVQNSQQPCFYLLESVLNLYSYLWENRNHIFLKEKKILREFEYW